MMPAHYDLSAGMLAQDAAERYNQEVSAAALGMVANG
jgi:hypothetical protein